MNRSDRFLRSSSSSWGFGRSVTLSGRGRTGSAGGGVARVGVVGRVVSCRRYSPRGLCNEKSAARVSKRRRAGNAETGGPAVRPHLSPSRRLFLRWCITLCSSTFCVRRRRVGREQERFSGGVVSGRGRVDEGGREGGRRFVDARREVGGGSRLLLRKVSERDRRAFDAMGWGGGDKQ